MADPKLADKLATYLRAIAKAATLEEARREAELALKLHEKGSAR